ncbi:MAG: LOG family protein [Metallosphaera sp.]|uniref:SLOG cluster 4 domain-containing protein n=1 Tax=Metallosphaera sp. TaxID=2020860 RepID=UPI0031616049
MQISVAALSDEPDPGLERKARAFVRSISKCSKPVIILGGYWGLMRVVADESILQGNKVVAILPEGTEHFIMPNEIIRVETGCDPRCRSVFIARSGDILVSLGGEAGTMTEILMAYSMGKAVYVLRDTGTSTDKLYSAFPEKLDSRGLGELNYFEDPERMGAEICRKYYGTS